MDDKRFLTGYHELHADPAVNFQLNRWINYLGPSALQEIREIAPKLTDFPNFISEFIKLGDKALADARKLHAAYYYRSAEFFMFSDNPDKQHYRNTFLRLVREHYTIDGKDYHAIPYTADGISTTLPALRLPCKTPPLDTLVMFGGSDSYIEEFLPILVELQQRGYDIVCFEGPGQGAVLEDARIPLTPHWNNPVKAVLDHFDLHDVTLMGISMGGCLVVRAAAFEKRVKRVIAYDILYDSNIWLTKLKPMKRWMTERLLKLKAKRIINRSMYRAMDKSLQLQWGIKHAMHIIGADTPYDYFSGLGEYVTGNISNLLDQDVLLMAGKEDFGVPLVQFYQQIEALKNVRSLTARLFTREEQAQNHCQVGNLSLALDVITSWIALTKRNYL